jgi:hypothetical protein
MSVVKFLNHKNLKKNENEIKKMQQNPIPFFVNNKYVTK